LEKLTGEIGFILYEGYEGFQQLDKKSALSMFQGLTQYCWSNSIRILHLSTQVLRKDSLQVSSKIPLLFSQYYSKHLLMCFTIFRPTFLNFT